MTDGITPDSSGDQVRRLQRLLDAAMLLNSTLAVKDLTEIILEIVRADVPVERVTAFRVDHQRKVVHSLVAQETDGEISLPIGSGIAGTVAATGTELDIPDAYADPRFNPSFDDILDFRTKDLLALPIFNREGQVVGVLELLNRLRPINESDLAFLRGISVYVGLALENAWLYREALTKQKIEEELVRVRDRLAQMERVTTMAQVLSGVVHEINNPLAIAMGNVGLLKDELAPTSENLSHLLAVERAIDRTATIVRRFVHLSEAQRGEPQATDLKKVLEQVIDLRSREWKRLGISTVIDLRPTPPIPAQEGELQLAFLHLLINAEEAAVRNSLDGRIFVRASHDAAGRQVRIEIEDSGPGIPSAAREQVFRHFYTTKAAGTATGLGLTTVRNIVERHRGRVWFETKKGRGTTFIVELPETI
jgi:signal transduction histidine kinase